MRKQQFDYGYFIFVQNYYATVPFFLVSWSLCVEEHFYLVVPLLFALWRGKQDRKIYLLVALAFAPAGCRLLEYSHSGPAFGYPLTATHLRTEGLILGFILSYISTYLPGDFRLLHRASPTVLVSSLALMILLGFVNPRIQYAFWSTALSLFFSSLLVVLVSCKEIGASNRLTGPVAITSYSIYLTHALAIHAARVFYTRFSEVGCIAYFLAMFMIVAASWTIFYYGVERTSVRIRDAYWPRRTTRAGVPRPLKVAEDQG